MIFSHISDTHLGFVQYHSEEREDDVYSAFNEAIDISIKDHVEFVILAGDIFHVPNPSGRAIVTLANALKRLRQSGIESFFILGEHDISRVRATPVSFVYHNLGFSRYIGDGKPFLYKDVLITGFDKRRKSEMHKFENDFASANAIARDRKGHRILVLHQGISEIHKFAGELSCTDLPKDFTYYAMGHLHEQELKRFSNLGGPLAYPGSTEMINEMVKETQKGFYQVDMSRSEASPVWIKLDTRPQISVQSPLESLADEIDSLSEKITGFGRKPIVEIRVTGKLPEPGFVQGQIAKLADATLRCFWKHLASEQTNGSVFAQRPLRIEEEMYRIAKDVLGSEELAGFAIDELLPLLAKASIEEAGHAINENYAQFKRGFGNATVS